MSWKMVLFGVLLVLVMSAFITGVWQPQPEVPVQGNDSPALQDFKAKLTVEAPFSTATVTVLDEGLVKYSANDNGEETTEDRVIEQAKVIELKQLVLSNGFMQLSPSYDNPELADASRYTIEVQLSSATKKVTCAQGRCPPEFKQAEDKIRELWGQEIVERGV